MITYIEIHHSATLSTFVGKNFTAERLGAASEQASAIATRFLRIANTLDALEHNTTGRTVPSIMEMYATAGEVLVIKTVSARKRMYTIGLLTITEED